MRLFTAIAWFFKILFQGNAAFADAPPVPGKAEKPSFATSPKPAIQLLAILQKDGRLLDFLEEDITGFSDDEVGAAVRDIHRGCHEALHKHLQLRRVLPEAEGSTVEIPENFDPSAIELAGNVSGTPPYKATVQHGGWYVEELHLPTVPEGADPKVAMPAQVEVSQ